MKTIIVAGTDNTELGDTLEAAGGTVRRMGRPLTKQRLIDTGVEDADIFVLTEVREATALALVRELTSSVRIVVYSAESIPDFASHLADVRIDPEVLDQGIIIEELLADST